MLGYIQFSGRMQRPFHLKKKKISHLISNVRSCRCKSFSIKQASGLTGGGVPILRTLPLDLPLSTAGVHQAIMSIYHVAS